MRGDLIETFKILKGFTNINPDIYVYEVFLLWNKRTQSQIIKERIQNKHIGIDNFFSNQVINSWNDLPQYLIDSDSINSFKNRLDN